MAWLADYPDGSYRVLREAAASYVGLAPENVVVGAGADDLILLVARRSRRRARAEIEPPTYALYRIATTLHGGAVAGPSDDADLLWVNPEQPDRAVEPRPSSTGAERPRHDRGRRRGVRRARGRSCARGSTSSRTSSCSGRSAFGFASLRVGYALAHPATAALLTERRAPAPISGPSAAIAAAALREPWLGDVETTIAERASARPSPRRLTVRDGDELRLL
jgi:histidinol-phosphate aminotransferase